MIEHPFWALGGVIAVASVLAFMIFLAALANGKREDEASDDLADGQCRTDWAEEITIHHGSVN